MRSTELFIWNPALGRTLDKIFYYLLVFIKIMIIMIIEYLLCARFCSKYVSNIITLNNYFFNSSYHLEDKENEAYRGQITCSRSLSL